MAGRRIKLKPGEHLSPDNIERAQELLENGGTKKAACELLGIAYNTKRLQSIIDQHNERVALNKKMRAKKRGKPVSPEEAAEIIKHYISTGSMEDTSRTFYRPVTLISKVLDKYGAKLRSVKTDYFDPITLPDECVKDCFSPGEHVWSARYNALARIDKEVKPGVYAISVYGPHQKFAYQGVEDLGSLAHLEALGIDFSKLEIYYKETSTTGDDD